MVRQEAHDSGRIRCRDSVLNLIQFELFDCTLNVVRGAELADVRFQPEAGGFR